MSTTLRAAEVTLSWTHPTPELVTGYKIYTGISSGAYSDPVDVGNIMTHDLTLPTGLYFFAATAYNDYGESAYSEELSAPISPEQPAGFTGTVTYIDGRIVDINPN